MSQEKVEEIREVLRHPGWTHYQDFIEERMLKTFQQMFALDPDKAESYLKFVNLKGQLDQLRDITYGFQLELAEKPEEVESVENAYSGRFSRILSRLLGRG